MASYKLIPYGISDLAQVRKQFYEYLGTLTAIFRQQRLDEVK